MQRFSSYTTGPFGVLCSAPTGQTEAQAGSWQCMQSRRRNLSPRVMTVVNLWSEVTSSAATRSSYGSLFCCAQPASHCLQPMQRVASYKSALLIESPPENAARCCGSVEYGTKRIGNRD